MATDFDIITIGGGLGGSALAKAMSENGKRVLIVEREEQFKDRVRGEQMSTWGVEEVRLLGIYELLVGSCANEMKWWDMYVGSMKIMHRDFPATTPQGLPNLTFYHPQMQETLLGAAKAAGADVWRGARFSGLEPGPEPVAEIERDGKTQKLSARLIVGADGRNSLVRKWNGFESGDDPDRLEICGVLFEDMDIPEDTANVAYNPISLQMALQFPQGGGRVRSYMARRREGGPRLQGNEAVSVFIDESIKTGTQPSVFEGAKPNGPLATFNGADSYVPHPYKNGVALVGDAAATSDPSWGQGLSLTVRDVRVLRDKLLGSDDWDAAGHSYAEEHDKHFAAVHTTEDWFTQLFYEPGPEAGARRAAVFSKLEADPDRLPDTFQAGPDHVVIDDAARRRFFGES